MMDGLPPEIVYVAKDERKVQQISNECIIKASRKYQVNPLLVRAVMNVEGGRVGTISKNTNGTYDLGIMQINTIWLDKLNKYGITWKELVYDPCVNIHVGAWILGNEIKKSDNVWQGVGNYHSRTPKFHERYKAKVQKEFTKLLAMVKSLTKDNS